MLMVIYALNLKHPNFNQMSNNQNKYIALPGGKECKKVNRFDALKYPNAHANIEANNPTYALTEVMPEGEVFSGISEWRYNSPDTGWTPTALESTLIFKAQCGYEVKEFIKPLKSKEPEKFNPAQFVSMDMENHKLKPLVDVVENKEERAEEIWKPVLGYEGYYEISSLKNVRSVARKINIIADGKKPYSRDKKSFLLKQNWAAGSYVVGLSKDGKETTFAVETLYKNAFQLPTSAVDELNLNERADIKEMAAKIYPYIKKAITPQSKRSHDRQMDELRIAYIKGYTESTHHTHASFVALVELLLEAHEHIVNPVHGEVEGEKLLDTIDEVLTKYSHLLKK